MTPTEHLSRIRAKCVELLEIASKRTPGKWDTHNHPDGLPIGVGGSEFCGSPSVCYLNAPANSDFIASCAGSAEAGWRATIAAISWLETAHISIYTPEREEAERVTYAILSAWPEELL